MKFCFALIFMIIYGLSSSTSLYAQVNLNNEEINNFFNNQNILYTYRDGEVLYGTYYFIEVHYCPNGYYGLYGNTTKRTVLGNEQKSNWQEYGTWKVTNQNGVNGVLIVATTGNQNFYPVYKLANGDIFVGQGINVVKQGMAICQY